MRFSSLILTLIFSIILPLNSFSQKEEVSIIVMDESEQPIPKASVVVDNNPPCITDKAGIAKLRPSRKLQMPFKVTIDKKGYEIKEFAFYEDDNEVEVIVRKADSKDFTIIYVLKEDKSPVSESVIKVLSVEYKTDIKGTVKVPIKNITVEQVAVTGHTVIGSETKGAGLYISVEEGIPISELITTDLTQKELEQIVYNQYKNDFETVTTAIVEERKRLEENNLKIREEIFAITERLETEKNLTPSHRKDLETYLRNLETTLKENSIAFKKSEEKTLFLFQKLQRIIHNKDSIHSVTMENLKISEKQRIAAEKRGQRNLIIFSVIIVALLLLAVVFYSIAIRLKKQKQSLSMTNDELRALKSELDEKVVEIKQQKDRIEDQNKELDMFVYKASHDIKGPLKSLLGLTDVGMRTIKDANSLEIFGHIHKSISKLDRLLSDLLQLSKAKSAKIVKAELNLKENILAVVDSFKNFERFQKVQINLDVPEEFCLHTDKNFFYSILQNFIENGIKYSDPAKENCYLRIRLEEKEDKFLIYFEDNGLGISQENIGRIFDMFYKVNDGSDGTGLGLYLVKHNLEKLGGKLSVESHLGQGSVFTIEFPKEASLVKVQV